MSAPAPTVTVLEDARAVVEEAARRFAERADAGLRADGRFAVVLAGGSTPRALYESLAAEPWRSRVDWSRTEIFFGDERCVAPDHPQSNYRMARETLIDAVPLRPGHVHRIPAELGDPRQAAAAYARTLADAVGARVPPFDLVLLGVGEDGHTASLFPGSPALEESRAWVAAADGGPARGWRVTLTIPALCASGAVLFLALGRAKARVVAEAFGGLPHPAPHPCERVLAAAGPTWVLLDRAAAGALPAR